MTTRAIWEAGPRVAVDTGVEVATWDLGGSGRPLLALHAAGFHARTWLPLAPVLGRAFHVWAVDLRGHGASGHSPPAAYRDWVLLADDVRRVVDTLDLAGAGLVGAGHSLGGALLLLAEQASPGLFAGLYCYEPVVPPPGARVDTGVSAGLAAMARRRRATFASVEQARANYAAKPPFSGFAPDALDAYVEHAFVDEAGGGVRLACSPEEEAAVYEGAVRHRAWEGLGEVGCEVTVATGSGAGAPTPHLEEMVAGLPRGRAERWERLTHFGPMENPAGVAQAVVDAVGHEGRPWRPRGPR